MKCPNCFEVHPGEAEGCPHCGLNYLAETEEEQKLYFDTFRKVLTEAYTTASTPWQQSGKSGTYETWVRLRIPIAEAVDKDGSFLDIGCANGFLLECLLDWTGKKGIRLEPFGLDYSPEILALAKERLPQFTDNLNLGNAWDWGPPRKFDFVRTELVYVPTNLWRDYIDRLLAEFLEDNGKLILAQYRSRKEDLSQGWINQTLEGYGYAVSEQYSGFDGQGRELCRIVTLINK